MSYNNTQDKESDNKVIRVLPQNVANRIAAGEVIERPASMLKELLENSIDSNAINISVTAVDGGIKSLIVEDDGEGIDFDSLPLALTHHATSKINSIDDLNAIYTLGFRGEALASISDVAHIEIVSSRGLDTSGGKIVTHGGELITHTPHPYPKGTRITVQNLFYNIPVRFKFLKATSREFIMLKEVFEKVALVNYDKSMILKNGDRATLSYKKKDTIRERVFDYLGTAYNDESFIEIEAKRDSFSFYMICSNQRVMHSNRKHNFIFLNGRVIENKSIGYSIKNAYNGIIPKDKFPLYFLYITLDHEKVDVNVHPSKKEVRIKNEREIAGVLYNEILAHFNATNKFVSVDISSGVKYSDENRDYQNNEEPTFDSLGLARDYTTTNTYSNSDYNSTNQKHENDYSSLYKGTTTHYEDTTFSNYTVALCQVFSSYIIASKMGHMYIIDQHAAYERLNYERMYKVMFNERIEYEKLLIPLEIEYKDYEIDILEDGREVLEGIGIKFETRSKNTVILEDIPIYFPKNSNIEIIIKNVLDNFIAKDKTDTIDKLIKNTCNMIACKYSPKAGDTLSLSDMQKLIDMLENENILTSCPHGRPFILRMSKEYLDSKFFR